MHNTMPVILQAITLRQNVIQVVYSVTQLYLLLSDLKLISEKILPS